MNDRRVVRSRARVAAAARRTTQTRSCEEDETDTSASDHNAGSPVTVRSHGHSRCRSGYCSDSAAQGYHHHHTQRLPPIGVYWDIENCQIPRGKSAVAVAQVIRDQFFTGYRETEFVVVCDVKRESPQVIQDLENAQVNVIHVGSQSKNAADEKLRQSIRRFADTHGAFGSAAAIVLISGDINFAPDLCDLRHRQKFHVILVHNDNCSESLMMCATETYSYSSLVAGLPLRGPFKGAQQVEVVVSGLPMHYEAGKVRGRLKRLAENCGGRVKMVMGTTATVRFPSLEFGIRAQKRMDKEDVFGSQITVSYPTILDSQRPDFSPSKSSNWRASANGYRNDDRRILPFNPDGARPYFKSIPPFNNGANNGSDGKFKKPFPLPPFSNQENVPNSVYSKCNGTAWENYQNKQLLRPFGDRAVSGRQNAADFHYEPKTNEGYSNGRHSLDSMLDFEVEREKDSIEKEKQSNATYENWLRNSRSNVDTRKCQTPPSGPAVLGINTSIPPPPIVDLPRRNDKYFFHPIQTHGVTSNASPSPAAPNEGVARCQIHSRGQPVDTSLTRVTVRLSDFSARLVELVTAHGNKLPLASLKDCYEAQFEAMVTNKRSISLQHLVSCVRGVEVFGGKYLRLTTDISPATIEDAATDGGLAQLASDMQSILTRHPRCELPFGQVVAEYNKKFNRPCRMTDYGCSRLIQLLERLPNVIQIMGDGADRVVTLTHRAQMQRFTADLLRVLQPGRRLTTAELSQLWYITFSRPLQPNDYGLCHLEDLLDCVSSSSVVVNGATVCLPAQAAATQRTPAQTRRLNQLIPQLVELLGLEANFTLEFAKFCPAYHRHFGVQIKLADYGCAKLVDLFEAIPHVVTVEGEMETGRRVSLTFPERLNVLSSRIQPLVQSRYPPGLYQDALECAYLWQHGHALRPENYGCKEFLDLLQKLPVVKVITNGEAQPIIVPATSQPETKQNLTSQSVVVNDMEVKTTKQVKTNGSVCVTSSSLLNLLKKAQDLTNGVNGSQLYNQLKPLSAEPVVKLLPPEQFLVPPSAVSPVPASASVFPSSPDPSVLPRPVGLAYAQVNGGFENACKLVGDLDWNKQNMLRQRVKLAPQFCPPLQQN